MIGTNSCTQYINSLLGTHNEKFTFNFQLSHCHNQTTTSVVSSKMNRQKNWANSQKNWADNRHHNQYNGNQLIAATKRSEKRLLLEYADIVENPLPGIGALPVENNIFLWHANLAGPIDTPWEGAILHATLNFNVNYPTHPPTLQLSTRISHNNVYSDGTVCMSILTPKSSTTPANNLIEAWNPAYTIKTILLQLQSFIFETNISEILKDIQNPKEYERAKKEWLSGVKWSVDQSRNFIDKTVGHTPPSKPWPPIPVFEKNDTTFLPENEYICFFTRQSYKNVSLGYGFSFSKNLRTGEISQIRAQVEDYISLKAFMNSNIRTSSLHENYTHFLPIYICPSNGEKAMHLAKRSLSIVCSGSHEGFQPEYAITVLPKLMNSMVSSMMNGSKLYSTRALIGYSHFHRLLIQFLIEFPELRKSIDEKISNFINDGKNRLKDVVPNIGDLLALISVSSFQWSDIEKAYINECFTRNIFWILNKFPQVENETNPELFLKNAFSGSETSLRLMLFQSFFIQKMAKPFGPNTTLKQLADAYDETFAIPSLKLESEFLEMINKISEIQSYKDFFDLIKIPYDEKEVLSLIKDSIIASEAKGYHGTTSENILSPEEYSRQSRKFDIDKYAQFDSKNNTYILLDNEAVWKEMTEVRWGINELPNYLNGHSTPWRKLYLQNNLQDLISNLNDVPDFPHLHKTCDISKEIPRIEILMFQPNNIKSKYFFLSVVLSKLENLNTLIIKKGTEGLSKNGFKALAKGLSRNKGNLENLILEHCGITEDSISELTSGEYQLQFNVRKLSLANNPLGDNGGKNLGLFLRRHENFPELEELDLSGCDIRNSGAIYIADAMIVKKKLKHLIMKYNKLDRGVMKILNDLSYSTSIETVDLSGSGTIKANSIEVKSFLEYSPSIKKLNLFKIFTSDLNSISYLKGNQSLESLDLANTKFSNLKELGIALAHNTTLKNLYLNENQIQSLHNLYYGFKDELNNPKSNARVKNPQGIIHLEFLSLSRNTIICNSERDYFNLGNFFELCKNLKELDLSYTGLNNQSINHFVEILKPSYNNSIKILNLRGNDIGKYMKSFSAAMQVNNTIEKLDISGNNLGAKGAAFVAEFLSVNNTLKELNLFGNFVEIEGAISIASALEKNSALVKLDLGLNRIRERGCKSIIQSIQKNKTLEILLLKHNHLADGIAFSLAKAIASEQSNIKSIALAGNFLTPRIRAEISLIISKASHQIAFDLSNLVKYKDPEILARTVIISEFKKTDPVQLALEIKKTLYKAKVGAILNVHILKRKTGKTMYAFVEFAHPDSVQLIINKNRNRLFTISGIHPNIARSGINETKATAA